MGKYDGPADWWAWVDKVAATVAGAVARMAPIAAHWQSQPKEKGEDRTSQKALNKALWQCEYILFVLFQRYEHDGSAGPTDVKSQLAVLASVREQLEELRKFESSAGALSYKWQVQTVNRVNQALDLAVGSLESMPTLG